MNSPIRWNIEPNTDYSGEKSISYKFVLSYSKYIFSGIIKICVQNAFTFFFMKVYT